MKTGIMVAANGARLGKDEHEAFPISTQEISKTALFCEEAGANAIHLHIRDDKAKHLLDVKKYQETINAIKKECSKDFIIQATTEAVGIYKPNEMISLIKELKPQATSVAIKELLPSLDSKDELKKAKDFYKFAREENIGVQHILYSQDELIRFHKLLEQEIICGDKHSVLFVLGRYVKDQNCDSLELIPFLQTLKDLNLENKLTWMLCAFGEKEIPSLVSASVLGGHNRIGFENSRVLPNGDKALNNESQIEYLKQIHQSLNIQNVSSSEMRNILGIYK